MAALLLSPSLGIKNIVKKQERCWCDYHKGMVVSQVEADLPNGVHFVIVKDKHYRLAIGDWEEDTPPPIVNPDKIEDMLLEAMAS
jgi:hypothetical protein